MHRIWFRQLTLPLWAVWLALAVSERPLSFDCQMRAAAPVAGHAMAGMSGMRHGAPKIPHGSAANCCGCLGDCGTASMAILPSSGDVAGIRPALIARYVPTFSRTVAGATRTDLALPYPNAPPLSALI